MIYITLIAVIAILLLQASGIVSQSSVGGPMTIALAFFAAALTVGIYEAWSRSRGVLGWIVSVVAALVGGILAAMLGSFAMDAILPYLNLQGSLVQTQHPMLYVGSAAMMLMTLLGSWLMLSLVNRWR